MKAFRKELAQRLGRALIKSSHHFRFRANQTSSRRRMTEPDHRTSVRAGATSIQNDSGLAQRLN
jgi:hypothetical protein